jgi:DNA-binding NtrC family response regulator
VTETQNQTASLLAVSEEVELLRLLDSLQESQALGWEPVPNGWAAMERVQSGFPASLLLLDLGSEGLHFLRWLRRLRPDLPVVVVCHPADTVGGREAVQLGAETLFRPLQPEQLKSILARHLAAKIETRKIETRKIETAKIETKPDSANLNPAGHHAFFFSGSLAMEKVRTQAELLAQSDVPVLLLGEPGSGKHAVASLIHRLSVRSGFRMVRVRCAEMPSALLEAEIFGEPGYTSDKVSAENFSAENSADPQNAFRNFAPGEKGTIFLDEITALPLPLQSRLMQVLRAAEAAALSGESASQVRILAASSASLEQALAEGQMREDLYYRLSAFTVQVPPLRRRRDEIPLLLRHFMHRLARHYRLPAREFPASVIAACEAYSWPGNLNEMEAFVKRFLVAGEAQLIAAKFPPANGHPPATPGPAAWAEAGETNPPRRPERRPERRPDPDKTESLKSLVQGLKSAAEQNAIRAALRRTGWNRKAAARLLSVSYRTLLYKIEQYQMRVPETYLPPVPELSLFGQPGKDDGKAS